MWSTLARLCCFYFRSFRVLMIPIHSLGETKMASFYSPFYIDAKTSLFFFELCINILVASSLSREGDGGREVET